MISRLHSIGRRGAVLLLLGVIWAVYGWTLLQVPRPPIDGTFLVHADIPQAISGGMWIGTGLAAVAFVAAPRPHDRFGFAVLILMPLIRLVSFGLSYVVYVVSGGDDGYELGLANSLIWAAVASLILIIAGWEDRPRIPRPPDPADGGRWLA